MSRQSAAAPNANGGMVRRVAGWPDSRFFSCVFGMAALAVCAPVWLEPSGHLASPPLGDKGTNLWNLWWVYYALFEMGANPLECPLIFHPWGCGLRYHTLSIVNGVLASPVTAIAGPEVSFNLLFLLWTWLTAVFAALWARELGLSRAAAFAAGFIASFNPYRWAHLEHLNLFSTAFLFASFLACERMAGGRAHWRPIAAFTLAYLLALFTDWYYGVFVSAYFSIRMALGWIFERETRGAGGLAKTLIPIAAAGAAVWLYFLPGDPPGRPRIEMDPVPAIFSAYWSLDATHLGSPLWLSGFQSASYGAEAEFRLHPGVLIFALGLMAMLRFRRLGLAAIHRRLLLGGGGIFVILALGPVLQWGGHPVTVSGVPIVMPALAFEGVPALTSIRVYARFAYPGFWLLSVLGLAWLDGASARWRPAWTRPAAFAMAVAVYALETGLSLPPMREWEDGAGALAKAKGPVLELPFTPTPLGGLHLYRQTRHHQPIFVAEFSRLNGYKNQYLEHFPVLPLLNRSVLGEAPNRWERRFLDESVCAELERMGVAAIAAGSLPGGTAAPPGTEALRGIAERCRGEDGPLFLNPAGDGGG